MKGYHSSLDGSDDNFNFSDDYDDDARCLSRMFNLLFCFLFCFYMSKKLEYAFRQDEYL